MVERNVYDPWYWILGVLYLCLAVAAGYRLLLKLRADGGSVTKKSRIVLFIYASLVAYGLARGVVVILTALDEVPHNQSLSETLFDMFPALLFCVLQAGLVAKWAGHVSDITFVLRHEVFAWRRPIIVVSIACCVVTALCTVATIGDEAHQSPYVGQETWVGILNAVTGSTYTVNGLLFAVLGLLLRSQWQPTSESDVSACRRILAIAVLFGGVCIVRGVGLIVFAGKDREHSKVVTSTWAAPLMLTLEWIALVTSLFGLTNVGGSAAGAQAPDPSQSEPMIGSFRAFGSSRRITFAGRTQSTASGGMQLQSMSTNAGDQDDYLNDSREPRPLDSSADFTSIQASVCSLANAGE